MAPALTPSRSRVIELLARADIVDYLPIGLGAHGHAEIALDGNDWCLFRRGIPADKEEGMVGIRARGMVDEGMWMPEHEASYFERTEEVIRVASAAELAEALVGVQWPWGGQDSYEPYRRQGA